MNDFIKKYQNKEFEELSDIEKLDLLGYWWTDAGDYYENEENLNEILDRRNDI